MSIAEEQVVLTAQVIVLWGCLVPGVDLSEEALRQARKMLTVDDSVNNWLYGAWNASYIASHGVRGSEISAWPSFPNVDDDTYYSCISERAFLDMAVVNGTRYPGEANTVTLALIRYSVEAHDNTLADPRFIELVQTRSQCVRDQGYTVYEDELGGIDLGSSSTEEQFLAAMLAEATCSDQMSFTQRAADINVEYEMQIIREHEAELVTIKHIADERVARATQILEEVGVL
ncbi:MAG: hypothetical protein LBG99_02555 [Propionibacteriaceae bacterium]|nr:hypothetical protein [Propionibacteriaceae bacterium]